MRPRNRLLVFLTIISLIFPGSAIGQNQADPRKPIIYGICEKPYPALFNVDYPLCRARAWLAALENAGQQLPDSLVNRLKKQGVSLSLARMALCALLFPIQTVTPENAQGRQIRVFLAWPPSYLNPAIKADAIFSDPWLLPLEMALIEDTRAIANKLLEDWPKSLDNADKDLRNFEALASELESLWQLRGFLESGRIPSGWLTNLHQSAVSSSIALAKGRENPAASYEAVNDALSALSKRELADKENAGLWNWLICQALYLRGLALLEKNQSALAGADFQTALARMKKTGAPDALLPDIYLARAELHRRRQEYKETCADYAAACANGRCEPLSLARRAGLCLQGKDR